MKIAIINDVSGLTFDQESNKTLFSKNKNNRKFVLDPLNDFIWNKSIINPYHEVGDETFLQYKKYEQEMKIFEMDKEKATNLEELSNKSDKLAESINIIDTKRIQGDVARILLAARHANNKDSRKKNA